MTAEIQILRDEISALKQTVSDQVSVLTEAVKFMARIRGERLTYAQVEERLGRTRKTITAMIRRGDFPEPCADGRWLLSEVMEWESAKR